VLFDGKEISADDIYRICYMSEERGLYKNMKVGEQAVYFARLKGMPAKDGKVKLQEWFQKFGIEEWWNKKIGELSKGMAQKVQFITTVLHEPKLLIFDEPFSGFDPINANLLKSEILALRDKGTTIIFSTHNMSSVEEVCDHITLIDKARNILSGNVNMIRHKYGANIFEIDYRGKEENLNAALGGICEIMESKQAPAGYNRMKVHIANDAEVRQVIAAANESVELRTFSEIIPSMNDIFIRAVNGNL
jgi:ABC-2 type transport system ATP-binding protein